MRAPELITDEHGLSALAARIGRADRVAVDVEANGLFAYRANLCTLQLAFEGQDGVEIAVVDTLAVDVAPLQEVLGEGGPLKVLHDLTFDAELLAGSGAPLGRVRDTSVAARFLGHEATGLGSVLERELGVLLDKSMQQHDWGKRPFTDAAMEYLAGDVAHLLELDTRLCERAREADILEEVEEESRHRARQAGARLLDTQPGYTRIKHASTLSTWVERAILRRVCMLRERLAESADVPSHRVMPSELMLQICRAKPDSPRAFRSLVERRRPGLSAEEWCEAIRRGVEDGDVPEEDKTYFERPTVAPAFAERRRRREGQVQAWRKAEALRRGVNEQAVLPGHCAHAVAHVLATEAAEDRREALSRLAGLGEKRLALYLDAWLSFQELE